MSPRKLSDQEIEAALAQGTLSGWTVRQGKLHRDYVLPDFAHAFGFMATAAVMIEAMGHHPEWSNVYDRVAVDLTTHDAGGITALDVELAEKLEAIARRLS